MTDRLTNAHSRVEAAASLLAVAARDDLAGAAWPVKAGGPQVSSSSTSDPTGGAVSSDLSGSTTFRLNQARDHQLAVRLLEQAASLLERGLERMTPVNTGEQCPTVARDPDTGEQVSCEGTATHFRTGRGLCARCDDWYGRPQNRGFHPGVEWVRDGNAMHVRWCACGPDCCDRDVQGHTSCTDRAAEGRTVSERCKRRMTRATTGR